MSDLPRLNGLVAALNSGKPAFAAFSIPEVESVMAIADADYDAIVIDMEHSPFDVKTLRDCLQYAINRRLVAESGSVAPRVTPLVRLPANGGEQTQWLAKQALDMGVYGIIWPHVATVEDARAAVAACRYSRPKDAPRYDPPGARGDGPRIAARYWGVTQQQYYSRADVWPIDPAGEIIVGMMCESMKAVDNLPDILGANPGIGLVLIGEGDLSQDLGYPRQYEHPDVVAAMQRVLDTCKRFGVACGHPHVDPENVDGLIDAGYSCLVASPQRSFAALAKGRKHVASATPA